jgi:hypothetical protein
MKIYLDIDGVLLANERAVADGADEFLQAVLTKYPDSTYWLTTHQWLGQDRAVAVLAPFLKPETAELIKKIKPSQWDKAKTEGIDFGQPFLWFDDDLYPEEKEVLEKAGKLDSHILVDLYKNPTQLKELTKKYFS